MDEMRKTIVLTEKIMGWKLITHRGDEFSYPLENPYWARQIGIHQIHERDYKEWNPFECIGQAMELADKFATLRPVKFKMEGPLNGDDWSVEICGGGTESWMVSGLARAICEPMFNAVLKWR